MALGKTGPALVLVVDDEALLRLNAVDFLHDAGFLTMEAANGADALTILEQNPGVDVLFTDIDMPGSFDGLELAAQASARWPGMRVIIVSGHSTPTADQLPPHGHFVSKPYTPRAITNLVKAV